MNELQAIVAGTIAGALGSADWIKIDVVLLDDGAGNFLPEIVVVGRESGTRLRVRIDVEDTT
jgi:hypothetical protein